MKKTFLLLTLLATVSFAQSQQQTDSSWKKEFRETAPIINDLVHTKLSVDFDFQKAYMNGKAWLTLKPHFYPTDSLTLDAKGMDIKKVTVVKGSTNSALQHKYDGMQLRIKLDKTYTRNDKYTIFIDYVSKPNELKTKGSAAITDAKGLYFINPQGTENKPTQIWTQGETEATSVWCPIIDKPNQKTTQEIAMTVPAKFVTLSNGKLASQKNNGNGTRTDTWKMDLPHAPYLFFMGVGDFAIVKDQYKGREVSYYVEKEYAPVARKIFGNTPEMMKFFARVLAIEYPWNKYSQIVGRDYVSGAMENTTATIHQESAQQDARELVDGNNWENTIAHELFHHWFGDLVTSESWSNLTLNESFANYSEYLWQEYKYGKDAALEHHFNEMNGYLQSHSEQKDLVRYYYEEKENMFDAVSYNKGGRVLHMLRNFVGDSAFFKSLNLYLVRNKFGTAEAHQLRIAFEEVTGRDLNWFWNQWYFGAGHPRLSIDYVYNNDAKEVKVIVKQLQDKKIFRLPIAVDVYNGQNKVRHNVWLKNRIDTLSFSYASTPDLVNVDADKMLLVEKKDNKTFANFMHQFRYAGNYLDRREAIDFAADSEDPQAFELIKMATQDKYHGIRAYALNRIDWREEKFRSAMEPILRDLASHDPKSTVRGLALSILGGYGKEEYRELFAKNLNDSSYSVAGAALDGLMLIDSGSAIAHARKLSNTKTKGKLLESVTRVLMLSGDPGVFEQVTRTFDSLPFSQAKFNLVQPMIQMLIKVDNTEQFKKGVDLVVAFRDQIPPDYGVTPYINNLLNAVAARKDVKEHVDYVKEKIK
jgi:aminopeptidase N